MSLVEVLVSAVILVVGLIGLLGAMDLLSDMDRNAREMQVATSAAMSKADEIKAYAKESFQNTKVQYNGQNFRIGDLLTATSDADGYAGKVTITDEGADIWNIQVDVEWRSHRRNVKYTLQTKITNRG